MHRFYLALSAHSSAWGSLSDLRGKLNYKAGGGKGGGMPFVTTQCCGNASLLFCFFLINGRQWLSRDCCLSFFLTEKKIQRLKKKEGASEEDADWKRLRRKQRCPFKVTFLTSSKWDTISAELCYCHLLPSLSDPKWLIFPVFSCTAIRWNHSEAMAAHSV